MRKYLFGNGLIPAVIGGITLLRSAREGVFSWRTALAWASWGITLALAIGGIVDTRRASHGRPIPEDSPVHGKEEKLRKQRLRR